MFQKFQRRCSFLIILTLASALIPRAEANIGEAYGFGSRSSALGGATNSFGFDGFAAYYNPAGLTYFKEQRLSISAGLTYNQPHFSAIDNVVVDNEFVSDATGPVKGNVSVDDYKPTFGTVFGATMRLLPQYWNVSAGLTAFLPLKQLAYIDTGPAYIPEYVMYRARTQRPQFYFALAAEPLEGLSFGAGLNLAFSMTTSADVFVQTNTTRPTTMRFAASLQPQLIPYFGVLYVSSKNVRDAHAAPDATPRWAYTLGSTVRLAGSSDNNMNLKTNARVLNPLPALPLNFAAASAMYYDPMTIDIGGSLQYTNRARVFLQLDYQAWSKFRAPVPAITPGSGISISSGSAAPMSPHDIFIPRIGHEFYTGFVTWRAGYSYRPSIFSGEPNGSGNYLDPSRDIFTAGTGFRFQKLLDIPQPWNLDLHGTFQLLRTQHIVKTSGNELDEGTGDRKIGAPGYTANGYVWGVGASVSVAM